MKREDLLCNTKPLLNENRLERKIFIKTPPETTANKQSVRAYPSPDGNECGGKCQDLSRFEMYYIFAEDRRRRRLLLAEYYNIDNSPPLVGWVNQGDGILWNTALGIRPSDDTSRLEIQPVEKCSERPQAADLSNQGIVLPGGDQWYSYDMRIALLKKESIADESYYCVAAPGVGIQAFMEDTRIKQLEELKKVDVFFLLDGTKSMQPNIDKVRRTAARIVDLLSSDRRFNETYFRFGFRVYRDDYFGNNGIGEGLALPRDTSSCQNRKKQSFLYRSQFENQIAAVGASSDDALRGDRTATENIFNGLIQAADDLGSCPEHTKLLFVIGDAGDNQEDVPDTVFRSLKSHNELVPIFLKTRHPTTNEAAFQRFEMQAGHILQRILPSRTLGNHRIRPANYLLDLQDADLTDKILLLVKNFSRTSSVNETILAIRAGQSPNQYLLSRMNERDLPILYWELVRRKLCGDGASADANCNERVDHRVIKGITPVNPSDGQWVEEIWMRSTDIDKWLGLLRPLSEIAGTSTKQKEQFATALRDKLQQLLGPPPILEGDVPLGEFLRRRSGLPIRDLSPLLQYSLRELANLDACELNRLISFARATREILLRVSGNPEYKVLFKRQEYPANSCAGISSKGRNIPLLVLLPPEPFDVQSGNREPRTYRYDRAFRGETRYWLPKEFLP
ncbi:MAG: VWA domain-containing protein [bacterium]|nr:VWA domain-containing protein [bacterium]